MLKDMLYPDNDVSSKDCVSINSYMTNRLWFYVVNI